MFDHLTLVLRTYTRAFVSQGVGIIGLAWCLAEGRAGLAVALTVLVLADQVLFLRGRAPLTTADIGLRRLLDGWCYAVSALDVLTCLAAVSHSLGLRDGVDGSLANSPLDGLTYVLSMIVHAPTALAPITAAGRLLGAFLAALGAVAFLGGLVAVLRMGRAGDAHTPRVDLAAGGPYHNGH